MLPTSRAHGVQIVKTCEALSGAGASVELVITNRRSSIKEPTFIYYGAKENFTITKLWCIDTPHLGWLGFWFEQLTFTLSVIIYALFKNDLFYTRDEFIGVCLKLIGKRVVWEAHIGQKNIFAKILMNSKTKIVVITQGLKDFYLGLGVSPSNIKVIPDAVDLEQFTLHMSKEEARKSLSINTNKKLVVYTGSKQLGKGVNSLLEAESLFDPEVELLMVTNKPYLEIPQYLAAADILVIPNSAHDMVSRLYTSPMKLFEYMASGRPIVASDIPSLREVLNDSNAYLFTPDDVDDLARVINLVLNDKNSQQRAKKALGDVKEYTWDKRAGAILDFIK